MVHNKLIMAVISLILGILFIAFRGSAVESIIRIIGFILLASAAVYVITYFCGKENKGNPSTMATAILCVLFGIICVITPAWLVALFPVVMGIILIINSIFNISAFFSVRTKDRKAGVSVVLSVLTLIFGIIALAHPAAMANFLIVFIGTTMLFNGVGDLVTISMMKQN